MSAAEVLKMEGVGKSFASGIEAVHALRNASLALSRGEFAVLTGPSGSGKSTCLHIAALLEAPSSGTVWLDGDDTASLDQRQRCRIRAIKIGMVFQKFCLLSHRSVIENVLFRFRYMREEVEQMHERARQALEEVALWPLRNRAARLLSGGEMQRVAIARAVVSRPALLIADEPTGNLDKASSCAVVESFRRFQHEGMAILMATHNETIIERDMRRFSMDAGRVRS